MNSRNNIFSSSKHVITLASVLLIGFFSVMAPQVFALEPPVFDFEFGNTGPDPLGGPVQASLNSTDYVYVIENGSDRVSVFDPTGAPLFKFGAFGSGNGQFIDPVGIVIGPSNDVYVLDKNNRRVQVFEPDGTYLRQFGSIGSADGQFNLPQGIAVDQDEFIYVADTFNQRIQKFDSDGIHQLTFGFGFGQGDGFFKDPSALAINDNNGYIYVTDTRNHRVQVFDPTGVFQFKFGSFGTGDGQFTFEARGIGIDDGNVFVGDLRAHRYQVFDLNGNFLTKFGTFGTGNGQFNQPATSPGFSNDGKIFIAEPRNDRVQVFAIPTVTPILTWDNTQYEIEHNGELRIDYSPANTDINSRQTISATIVSDDDPAPGGITIQLKEENNNSSIFVSESWVRFTAGSSGSYTIQTSPGTTAKAQFMGEESSAVGIVQTTNTPPPQGLPTNIITPIICSGSIDDKDGDSICDAWENSGAGLIVVDDDTGSFNTINFGLYFVDCTPVAMLHPDVAAANGGNPLCPSENKADVYLEIDYMELHGPPLAALHDINKAFYEAPYTPPGCGTCQSGINLHILLDDADSASIGHQDEITVTALDGSGNTDPAGSDFDQLKQNHFGTAAERAATDIIPVKAMIYHYGLIAHDLAAGDKGATGIAESPGNDFVVSLGSLNDGFGSVTDLSGTIMHELGHNFDLKHGGPESQGGANNDQDDGCKPNYLSVMNYAYQIPNNVSDRPLDFSAHNRAGTTIPLDITELSIDEGLEYSTGDTRWTKFAHGTGDPQDIRTTSSLPDDSNPTTGVFWNSNLTIDGVVTDANINDFGFRDCQNDEGNPAQKTLVSLDDWNNLVFNFQSSGTYYDGIHNNPADTKELTSEIIIQMRSALLNGLLNQILALPDSAFNDPVADRQTFTDDITVIDEFVTQDELEFASTLLQILREKLDSSDGGDPSDDLITTATAQAQLLPQIDNILDSWTLAVEPAGDTHDAQTPFQTKQQLLEQLESLNPQAQENKTEKEIDKAIKDIQKSLKPTYWISEDRLDPKKGDKVFKEEKDAVKRLIKIIDKDKESQLFLASIQQIIDTLTDVDRTLAQTTIDDAQVFAGVPKADKEIDKANKEMDKAQQDLDDGKPDKAIKHYEKAWEHAQHAMKHQTDDDDDDDE